MKRLLFLALILAGCGQEETTSLTTPATTGTLALTFQRTAARTVPITDAARRFDVAVHSSQGQLLTTASAVNATSLTIPNLPVGTHTVSIVARDANLEGLATGQLQTTISAGQTRAETLTSLDEPDNLTITPPTVTLQSGSTQSFQVNVPQHGVTFTTSNPEVVRVDKGLALAIGPGTATITATFNSRLSATATVTVRGQGTSLTVPIQDYASTDGSTKTALFVSVGNGKPVLTELDTGSNALVVEQEFCGNDVTLTNVGVTITYNGGTNPRPGVLGFAPYTLLDTNGKPVVSSALMPIMVVAKDVVSQGNPNHAIFGVGTGTNISPKLFLPAPYNGMLLLNRPNHELSFGTFPLEQFATVPLSPVAPTNPFANPSPGPSPFGSPLPLSTLGSYDDDALPVVYTLGGTVITPIPSLIDTGASTNFQAPSSTTPGITVSGKDVTSSVAGSLTTSKGPLPMFFNSPIKYAVSTTKPSLFCNLGNEIANHYTILLDQVNGQIGLGNLTR